MKLQRILEQEYGLVKFWAEDSSKRIIASLIQSKDFQNEMEIRVVTDNDIFTVRGHKTIMDKFTFEQFLERVKLHLERNKKLRRTKNEN